MNKPIFRSSYTMLHIWQSGDWEHFVKSYFHLGEQLTTREMSEGKEFHSQWQKEIEETKCLPKLFGGTQLKDPKCEVKKLVKLEDWLEFVFIADMVDGSDIHEFKTGVSSSSDWVKTNQIACYGVGMTFDKHFVDRGFVHHWDQYNKRYDMSMIWLTDKVLQETQNWIETLSSEAYDYLLTNKLYERFGKRL